MRYNDLDCLSNEYIQNNFLIINMLNSSNEHDATGSLYNNRYVIMGLQT